MSEIILALNSLRAHFNSGITHNYEYRLKQLKALHSALDKWEEDIFKALYADLGKSEGESFMTELAMVKSEIHFYEKNLHSLMKKKRVSTPIIHFPSSSYIISQPRGVVLIMSPWNYPIQLTLSPLAAAIAAGNCAIIKPSRYSSQSSKIIKKIIEATFSDNYIKVFEGGSQINQELLDQKFDFIFFTGSPFVGHIVMEKASKFLTPIALELGGKSPVYVDSTANLKYTARRLAWGKFLNAGQTCVAPDYVLCHSSVFKALITELKNQINEMYGTNPIFNNLYPKIINEKHFKRLIALLDQGSIAHGGQLDPKTEKIAPTLIVGPDENSQLMSEEIFGPILPIIKIDNFNEAIDYIRKKPHPLALYLFSTNKEQIEFVENQVLFGGGCINDCIIHLSNPKLPFGGVGESGLNSYHGKKGFETFSHTKSIIKKSNIIDLTLRNPPYDKKLKLFKKLMNK